MTGVRCSDGQTCQPWADPGGLTYSMTESWNLRTASLGASLRWVEPENWYWGNGIELILNEKHENVDIMDILCSVCSLKKRDIDTNPWEKPKFYKKINFWFNLICITWEKNANAKLKCQCKMIRKL